MSGEAQNCGCIPKLDRHCPEWHRLARELESAENRGDTEEYRRIFRQLRDHEAAQPLGAALGAA